MAFKCKALEQEKQDDHLKDGITQYKIEEEVEENELKPFIILLIIKTLFQF